MFKIRGTAPTIWAYTSHSSQTSIQNKTRTHTRSILTNLNLLSSKGAVTSRPSRSWLPKFMTSTRFRLHTRLQILVRAPTATLSAKSWSNCMRGMVFGIRTMSLLRQRIRCITDWLLLPSRSSTPSASTSWLFTSTQLRPRSLIRARASSKTQSMQVRVNVRLSTQPDSKTKRNRIRSTSLRRRPLRSAQAKKMSSWTELGKARESSTPSLHCRFRSLTSPLCHRTKPTTPLPWIRTIWWHP